MPVIHKVHVNKTGLRVSIPARFARSLGWVAGDEILVFITEDEKVLLEKITPERYPQLYNSNAEAIIQYDEL